MEKYFCTRCKSEDLIIEERNPHNALICKECGKWIKWVNKDEKILIEKMIKKKANKNKKRLLDPSKIKTLDDISRALKFLNNQYIENENPTMTGAELVEDLFY